MTSPSTRRRLGVAGAAVAALVAPLAVALPAHASSTAHEIVYTADADNDGVYSIVLRDLLTGRGTTVLPADTEDEWLYDDPELSPDGGRIAFSTDNGGREPYDEGIAVVNRDGSGFRRLTTPPAPSATTYTIDVGPAWSPDGSRLLFTRITTDTSDTADIAVSTALHTVPAAGGAATPVPGASDGYLGDWSPDGRRIVFTAVDASGEVGTLTVVGVDGTGRRTITGAVGQMPAWSPDGSTIAFARITERDPDPVREEDVAQIATVPADGGAVTTFAVTRPSAARTVAGYPSWSPDGESLVYDLFGYSETNSYPPGDLWSVDRAGTRAGRLIATPGDEAQGHLHGPAPRPVAAGVASTYTPVTPTRLLDTRNGTGASTGPIGPRGTVDLAVHGAQTPQGPVPANASAVVLNVTVTGTTGTTDVRAYPAGSPVAGSSNLNAGPRQTVPNLVTVRLGANGAVTLRNAAGSAHLIADLAGYYTPDGSGAGFAALDPSRVLDTRTPGVGSPGGKVGPAGTLDLQVTGDLRTADGRTVSVPAGARAVVLNVTATGPTAGTDVRVYPTPTADAVPTVSNLNLSAGQTAANLVTVAVGEDGQVRLRNLNGTVHLIADLAGYYAAGASGRFVPVDPARFLDTRTGVGGAAIPTTARGFVDLKVAGTRGVPAAATAAVLNLTGTGVSATTDVRAFPAGASTLPTVSNLNLTRGVTRANLAIVKTGRDGRVRIRNNAGQVDLIGDLAGYMVG